MSKTNTIGFYRLPQIIGDKKANPPVEPIIPVSKSTWWAGVKSGRFPAPEDKFGPGITVWKKSVIHRLAGEGEVA